MDLAGGSIDSDRFCEDGLEGVAIAGFLAGYCPVCVLGDHGSGGSTSSILDGIVHLLEGMNKSPNLRMDHSRHVYLPVEHLERPT